MKKNLILCLVLILGACSSQNTQPTTQPITQPIRQAVAKAASAVETVFARITAFKPKVTAENVLGKDDAWLRATLGEPTFIRADLHANIWQYKNESCVLSLFLYPDTDTSPTLSIMHFDARDALGHNMDRDRCLATF
ncbi:MAG: hypothetical protein JKY17_06130 [Magnetovibrio sp.]|nr:hypothetical protein [Magnetovibrio sp.]